MHRVWVGGEFAGHEADLNEGPHAVGEEAVINLIDVGKVVDGIALRILVVDADFVMKDGVKAHVIEVGDLLYGAEIVAIAFAQRENGAAGAEGTFPEVRKGRGRRLGIDDDGFLGEKGGEGECESERYCEEAEAHGAPMIRADGRQLRNVPGRAIDCRYDLTPAEAGWIVHCIPDPRLTPGATVLPPAKAG